MFLAHGDPELRMTVGTSTSGYRFWVESAWRVSIPRGHLGDSTEPPVPTSEPPSLDTCLAPSAAFSTFPASDGR